MQSVYLTLRECGPVSGKPVVTVKDRELIARAHENYRRWKLGALLNIGKTSVKPCLGITSNFNPRVEPEVMVKEQLRYVIAVNWMEEFWRKGQSIQLPLELRNLQERKTAKVSGEVPSSWRVNGLKWPSIDGDNVSYPKIKHLLRHFSEVLSGYFYWCRHLCYALRTNNTNGALKCCYSTSLWPAKMLVYSKRSRFRLIFPSGSS
ncbi:MAG: hypothetical protein JNJ83_20750 [Verrucomicrobiaceae bacterium]|nr:hypothetical protein [Verrucomicrobiaceae bacterium]